MNPDRVPPHSSQTTAAAPVPEEVLHAAVDGQLPEARREVLEQQLQSDAEAGRTFRQWSEQREALRALHTDVTSAPIPASMLETLQRASVSRQRQSLWWRWGGMAAGILLAFTAGWLVRGPGGVGAPPTATLAFARQAAVAHAVYAVDQRHPVEVSGAEQDHLVQWLSRRLGKPLSAPVLTSEGFELLGGRLLPGNDGARAQFMYQSQDGSRLTLYVGALTEPDAVSAQKTDRPSVDETAFRFTAEGPVPGFYWVDKGFGYALSGPLPKDQLMRLAHVVHGQL